MVVSRRFGTAELVLVVAMTAILVGGILILTNSTLAEWNVRLFRAWTDWAVRYGYFGAFITALIGNLTIVVVFPYTILVFFLATSGLNPLVLGTLTGIGAELGELSGYFLGRAGAGAIHRHRPKEYTALQRLIHHRPKVVPALLFLFSMTPMPDDILFIPLGILRYSVWKLIVPSTLGKITAGLIIVFFGRSIQTAASASSVRSVVLYQLGTLLALTILMYAIAKVPWSRVVERFLRTPR
ncbi:MAG: VTT domain-containing protein [Candidatus Kerfeldbacteria bacterium]|nr:VTT domain-containing protein [Candidatus Kerfeldbacteria bacterium]